VPEKAARTTAATTRSANLNVEIPRDNRPRLHGSHCGRRLPLSSTPRSPTDTVWHDLFGRRASAGRPHCTVVSTTSRRYEYYSSATGIRNSWRGRRRCRVGGSSEADALAPEDDRLPRRVDGPLRLSEIGRAAVLGQTPAAGAPQGAPARCCPGARSQIRVRGGAYVHHRSTPRVDRADDLLGIDALQVNARRGHVRMPELTLDDGQRHPLARELDRVRMPKLVRREPSPDTSSRGVPAQLPAHGGRRPRPPASRSVDHAEQRPDGQLHTARESRSELIAPRPGVHPGLAALVTLAIRVRGSIRVAGRDRTRSTTTPPGSGARRATARR
jgi:hypothetical protein